MGGRRALAAALALAALTGVGCSSADESEQATGTTTVAAPAESTSTTTASTTTSTGAPSTTIETSALRAAPGAILTVDVDGGDLEPGTPLFIVQQGQAFPGWARVGAVGDAELRMPPDLLWRLTGPEFGTAELMSLQAGRYDVVTRSGDRLLELEITADGDGGDDIREERSVDPETAILRPDGLADVDFGTPVDDAVRRLTERFGPPAEDTTRDGCVRQRVLRWDDGLHARFDDSFAEYAFYAWDEPVEYGRDTEIPWPPVLVERPVYTTELGTALGDSVRLKWPGLQFSGGYDSTVFADLWFEAETLGGRLSGDVTTHPDIITIEAGRDENPARRVC